MLKKDIKGFFKAVRASDLELVKELHNKIPELVNACHTAPPKKDDGQSPLHVAYKTGNYEIADYLISQGADVNFIEQSTSNEWNAPVIHDCIRGVAFNTYGLTENEDDFNIALKALQNIIVNGASVNSEDSYGNTCLARAILDTKQIIDREFTDEIANIVYAQYKALFRVLLGAGADPDIKTDKRQSAHELIERFKLNKYNLV
ncbi:ankyrin repeat domain-containing protein [Teredinibacter franksiae]|uniref:ankyrin repeat domain-containing protein n=1 Tax=Teredinibacter franksiae TaxID=2761453 RepID=UPI001627434F|nr:ankyrin repeat domain-containing protein [Teredinibacter franksiae]